MLVAVDRGFQAECDQCSTRCAPIAAADANAALSVLRAAGWSFGGVQLTYCPKCGTLPASPSSKRRIAAARRR